MPHWELMGAHVHAIPIQDGYVMMTFSCDMCDSNESKTVLKNMVTSQKRMWFRDHGDEGRCSPAFGPSS